MNYKKMAPVLLQSLKLAGVMYLIIGSRRQRWPITRGIPLDKKGGQRFVDHPLAKILRQVVDGQDIYDYSEAQRCRELERCDLVDIVDPQMPVPPGHERQPYFGCIANDWGKALLSAGGLL